MLKESLDVMREVNNISTKTTFLGKETTTSVKVVKLSQKSESTFSVWIGKC